ncbi:MAG: topoisomerase DNA-binding C4 zinc finger domain-containing protein [Selenomonadaceae bacterium]|nr:topoisomerase DNA-binding C4 zinc finger domain-containing protein [Selenomonadaceae bacterium]
MAGKILKSVILVESATKARTLRKFVGRNYSVLSTDGFLKDLPKSRIGIDDDYQPDYITVRGKGTLLTELKRETLNARRIFLATNPDAQGEFMARQCCEIFGINPLSRCRIVLDELTKENFKAKFDEARPIDDNLADAFQTKQIIDKYVSHKIGDYLDRKIWRGVKIGRFRAILLNLIANPPKCTTLKIGKMLTPTTLQELALNELNFTAVRTRFIAEQLYEGINFEGNDCAGLITYPHGRIISLTSERHNPEEIQEYLTDYQFRMYGLIYSYLDYKKFDTTIKLDGLVNDAMLMSALDSLGVNWADYYSVGIASLLKRKYIVSTEESTYEITPLGKRVIDSVKEYFGELFAADIYNSLDEHFAKIGIGKCEKSVIIENYCAKFNVAFSTAMNSLGENAQPQSEPVTESEEICEKCGRKMLIRHGRYGTFLACSGYPECKNAKPLLEPLEQKCPKCGEHLAKRSLSRGRLFYCCKNTPKCDFMTWDEPQTMTCKTCGATMFVHRFKDRAPMLYCGNDNCPTRENHPVNKILADIKRRSDARRDRKAKAARESEELTNIE